MAQFFNNNDKTSIKHCFIKNSQYIIMEFHWLATNTYIAPVSMYYIENISA